MLSWEWTQLCWILQVDPTQGDLGEVSNKERKKKLYAGNQI